VWCTGEKGKRQNAGSKQHGGRGRAENLEGGEDLISLKDAREFKEATPERNLPLCLSTKRRRGEKGHFSLSQSKKKAPPSPRKIDAIAPANGEVGGISLGGRRGDLTLPALGGRNHFI